MLTGGTKTRFGYEGKEADSIVGDTDFRARKYRPDLGIFTQPDTLIQNVYDPQSLNRYSFERNNTYKYTDSTGHDAYEWIDLIVARTSGATLNGLIWLAADTDLPVAVPRYLYEVADFFGIQTRGHSPVPPGCFPDGACKADPGAMTSGDISTIVTHQPSTHGHANTETGTGSTISLNKIGRAHV